MTQWFHKAGTLARDGFETVVDDSFDGWQHTGLRVADLGDGGTVTLPAVGVERLVIPLSGSATVVHEGTETTLAGRASVFEGPTDVLYLGIDAGEATITGTGRIAIAEAPTAVARPSKHIARDAVPVELRGGGRASRQVHDCGTPAVLDAGSFIVCEVITPAGNWSSHPAHKHDEHVPGVESRLEEIYYFEFAARAGTNPPPEAEPFGLFASYDSPAGAIDIGAVARSGDVALVPHGYHGPASAAPEYDMYYLNVMAGPDDERVWRITDDPAQTWVRTLWEAEGIDPRLPFRNTEAS